MNGELLKGIILGSTITGATAVGGYLAYENLSADSNSSHNHQIEFNPPSKDVPFHLDIQESKVKLQESPFSKEKIDYISKYLGKEIWSIGPEWDHLDLVRYGGGCLGFMAKDDAGQAHFITADHCVPHSVKSNDGKRYGTLSDEGPIFSLIINLNNKNYNAYRHKYYDVEKNPMAPDLALLDLANPEQFTDEVLPLADSDSAKTGDAMLHFRWEEDNKVATKIIHYLGKISDGRIVFLSLENPETTCAPGSSGGMVVNQNNEIIGMIQSVGEVLPLSEALVKKYNLQPELIGRKSILCLSASPEQIKELIKP